MKVLVCGSRCWTDGQTILRTLGELPPDTVIIHGAARGADSLAGESAMALGMKVEAYPANWRKYGKAAGPIRNMQMIEEGKPDRVIAFRLDGVSRGTDDMIRQSEAFGLPVTVIHEPIPSTISGYTYNPTARWPESDDRPCPACGRAEDGPHGYPCVDEHDLVLIAAEMAEREDLDGYEPEYVGFERVAAGE